MVGSLDTKPMPEPKAEPALATPAPKPKPKAKPTTAVVKAESPAETSEPLEPFGHLIPFADPSWYQGVSSTRASLIGQSSSFDALTIGCFLVRLTIL